MIPAFLPPRPGASAIEDQLRRQRNRWVLVCAALWLAAAFTWTQLVVM